MTKFYSKQALVIFTLTIACFSFSNAQTCLDIDTGEITNNEFLIHPYVSTALEPDGITVTYSIPQIQKEPDKLVEGAYWWKIPGFTQISDESFPALPVRIDSFTLPLGCDSVRVVMKNHDIKSFNIKLAPGRDIDNISTSQDVLPIVNDIEIGGDKIATLSCLGNFRNHKVAHVKVMPASYLHKESKLDFFNTFTYKIEFLDNNGNAITFKDSSKNSPNKIKDPNEGLDQFEINDNYLIVSIPKHEESIKKLVALKQLQGFNVNVCYKDQWTTSQVTDSIEKYSDNLSHVLLVGSNNEIPAFSESYTSKNKIYRYPSDYRYSCLTEKSPTDAPDLYIGRIASYQNRDKIQLEHGYLPDMPTGIGSAIDKIIGYERNPVIDSHFYSTALHCAKFETDTIDLRTETITQCFVETSEKIRNYVINQGKDINRVYAKDERSSPQYYSNGTPIPNELSLNPDIWKGNADSIAKYINSGTMYVLYSAHGGENGWSKPQFKVTNESNDVERLTNKNKYPLVLSTTCSTGDFSHQDCFASEMLNKADAGAMGLIAASVPISSNLNKYFIEGLVNGIWPTPGLYSETNRDSLISINPREPYIPSLRNIQLKTFIESETLGSFMRSAVNRINSRNYSASDMTSYSVMKKAYHLFGDPSLIFHTDVPTEYSDTEISIDNSSWVIPLKGKIPDSTVKIRLPENEVAYVGYYNSKTGERKRFVGSNLNIPITYSILGSKIRCNENIYVYGKNRIPCLVADSQAGLIGPVPIFEYQLSITPNPVRTSTKISFSIAPGDKSHNIVIHDWNGIEIKDISVPISDSNITLNVNDLPNGTYIVSLIVNGKKQASEQMIVSK
ncbi:MAG: T9SS type A sorting domain-containing protein [Muribaculaceae bacterium]|nr:T9SS type A sorting domain-containing protein [Muribaculaceae bacterium]